MYNNMQYEYFEIIKGDKKKYKPTYNFNYGFLPKKILIPEIFVVNCGI